MRVFLVDAERSLHRGVQMRLEREPDVALIAEADTLTGALEKVAEVKPDVVLVDPVGLGADPELVIADLHHAYPGASLVVLSLRDDQDSRERVQSAGAAAFVSKHDGAERLLQVIRQVGRQASTHA
jgi:DNA-binding NarL/FixJ family response regulator